MIFLLYRAKHVCAYIEMNHDYGAIRVLLYIGEIMGFYIVFLYDLFYL